MYVYKTVSLFNGVINTRDRQLKLKELRLKENNSSPKYIFLPLAFRIFHRNFK